MSGDELKRRRESLDMSRYDLSHEFDVAASSIYRWEDGSTPLSGLMAIGADTVLKRLERQRRAQQGAADGA